MRWAFAAVLGAPERFQPWLAAPQACSPGLDPDRQAVRRPRQRAVAYGREDAGRVVGAVEVDDDRAVGVGRIGVEVAAAAIRLVAVRRVAEDEPQLARVAARQRLKPMRRAVDLEDDVAGRRLLVGGAEDVGDLDRAARASARDRVERARPGRPASDRCRRTPRAPARRCSRSGSRAAAALDDAEPQRAELEQGRLPVGVADQRRSSDRSAGVQEAPRRRRRPRSTVTVPAAPGRPAGRRRHPDRCPTRFAPGFSQPSPARVSQPVSLSQAARSAGCRQASTASRCAASADAHPAGRKMRVGAGRGPMPHVGRRAVADRVRASPARPDAVVPSRATAIGPSPNRPGRPPRSPRSMARPGRARCARGHPPAARAEQLVGSGVVPGVADRRRQVGGRAVGVDGGEDEAARRLGPVIDRPREEAERGVVGRGHVEQLGRRRANAPPQDARLVPGLGIQPLREALGAALAQDAVESRLIAAQRSGRG